jgi:addiction module HigA family antidote
MAKLRLTHPGRILREEFLEPKELTPYALAKAINVPLPRVNDIVRENRGISSEMAVLLAAYFDTTEQFWSNLQAHYDLSTVKPAVVRQAARIRQRQEQHEEAAA